jgi:hypothetical protein
MLLGVRIPLLYGALVTLLSSPRTSTLITPLPSLLSLQRSAHAMP